MNNLTLFRIVQGFYWLSIGAWFGALIMLAIAAAITFHTVQEYQPLITAGPYLYAPVENSPQILAGGIVGNVLRGLAAVQVVCAAVAGGCIALQCTVFTGQLRGGSLGLVNLVRIAFVMAPILLLGVDQLWLTPQIWSLRKVMYDTRESVHVRETVRGQFDTMHHIDERVVSTAAWFLLAAVLLSAFVFKVGGETKLVAPAAQDREHVPPT